MALSKKPVTGMKDILPAEMQIRDYVIGVIKETYGKFGFTSIETPCVENIENLSNKQGGENEKLIFKILKRGEKLKLETAESEKDLVDGGLRYDLTVPLVRYYSNHANELPTPFKALQMGNVVIFMAIIVSDCRGFCRRWICTSVRGGWLSICLQRG